MASGTLNDKWLITLLLCLFLGTLGVHRFYAGKTKTGVIMLLLVLVGWLLFGLGPIAALCWAVYDLVMIILSKFTDASGKVITMNK